MCEPHFCLMSAYTSQVLLFRTKAGPRESYSWLSHSHMTLHLAIYTQQIATDYLRPLFTLEHFVARSSKTLTFTHAAWVHERFCPRILQWKDLKSTAWWVFFFFFSSVSSCIFRSDKNDMTLGCKCSLNGLCQADFSKQDWLPLKSWIWVLVSYYGLSNKLHLGVFSRVLC